MPVVHLFGLDLGTYCFHGGSLLAPTGTNGIQWGTREGRTYLALDTLGNLMKRQDASSNARRTTSSLSYLLLYFFICIPQVLQVLVVLGLLVLEVLECPA